MMLRRFTLLAALCLSALTCQDYTFEGRPTKRVAGHQFTEAVQTIVPTDILLGERLDGLRTTLFRQTLFAEFELRIHEIAEKGEALTGEKLTDIYRGLLKEYYGDAAGVCKINDLYGAEWAYIPHFYSDFYVYQYATSMVASAKIAAGMRAEAQDESGSTARRDAYLQMLSAGSSKSPIDLLKDAGVDMTTSAPFAAAMKEMNDVMDEMEKILAEKDRP